MKPAAPPPAPALDSLAAAIQLLASRLEPIGEERVLLDRAAGRILAEPIALDRPSPPTDCSAMDGYALRLADAAPGRLAISGEAAAGASPPALRQGAAVRIFTGAPVPPGAEAVIPREQVQERPSQIVLPEGLEVRPGQHIRRAGENARPREVAVSPGRPLGPAEIGAAATCGRPDVAVRRRVRIGIVVSGSELRAADQPAEPWQIRDSNGPALEAMFHPLPWAEASFVARAADTREGLASAMSAALEVSDALLVTGGVSAGDYDFVPEAIAGQGGELLFHKLPIRPGKPVLGALAGGGQPILGLPGNPLSVMVTARRLGGPVLRRLAGFDALDPPALEVEVLDAGRAGKVIPLTWFRPVRIVGSGAAELAPSRGSGDVISAARSDGFVEVPPGEPTPGRRAFYRWTFD